MKVNIGKYASDRWWTNISYKLFGYAPKQKVKVRIDNYDTWSMDTTLAFIILPMLKQLKETKCGYPNTLKEDGPHITTPDTEGEGYNPERWDYILDEMIFAFEHKLDDDWKEQYCSGNIDFDGIPYYGKDGEEIGTQLVHGPNHTYKMDTEGYDKHQKRIANGFLLFGRYYENLWD